MQRPDEEFVHETTERTRKALEEKLQLKIKTAGPASAAAVQTERTTKFIRYAPANENPAFNSGAKNRIIRMVEVRTQHTTQNNKTTKQQHNTTTHYLNLLSHIVG